MYGLTTIVGRFLNFLLVPLYLSRLNNAAEYGEVSVMYSYSTFLSVVLAFGMETAFFYFARKKQTEGKSADVVFSTASWFLIFTGTLLIALVYAFSEPLVAWAGYPGKMQYVQWFAIILAADALTAMAFAWLRLNEKPWIFSGIRLLNIGVNMGANLFFLLVCPWLAENGYTWVQTVYSPENLINYIFLSNVLASLVVIPFFWKLWTRLSAGFDKELFSSMIRYSMPVVVIGLAGMVNETLDRVLLKKMLPANVADTEAGIYSAFYKLSMVMTMFVQAFRFAAEPFFFKESGSEQAHKTYADVLNWFVYTCGFIYVATMVCLPWLAPLLLRKAFYYNDVRGMTIVPVLLMANLLLGMYYSISIWYRLTARTSLGALIAILGAGVTLVLNFTFIPQYGFIASAWATLAAYGFMVLLAYALGQRYFPVPYNVKRILFILFGAMILGMIAQAYNEVLPVLSYLAIPGYLLMIWYAEKGHYAYRKNH